jgi:hypothetical protein
MQQGICATMRHAAKLLPDLWRGGLAVSCFSFLARGGPAGRDPESRVSLVIHATITQKFYVVFLFHHPSES